MPKNRGKKQRHFAQPVGTEELAHWEMLGVMIRQCMAGTSCQELSDAGLAGYYTMHNHGVFPADPNGAWYTSGIRIGTPALTTRGFGADEFDKVAELIVDVLKNTTPVTASNGQPGKARYTLEDGVAARTKAASAEMLDAHQLYPGLVL